MSNQKEQAAKGVANEILNICGAIVMDELSITDIQNQLQVHPFLVDKTGEELKALHFEIALSMVNCAVKFMIEERNNELARR